MIVTVVPIPASLDTSIEPLNPSIAEAQERAGNRAGSHLDGVGIEDAADMRLALGSGAFGMEDGEEARVRGHEAVETSEEVAETIRAAGSASIRP